MAKRGFRIIDSDMHVVEPHDLWLQYLDPAFRDRAPQIGQSPLTGAYGWRCEGRMFPAFSDDPARGTLNKKRYDLEGQKFRRYDEAMARRFDARSQLDAMDVEGIDVAVSFRTMASHVIAIDEMDPRLADALCRAFNRWHTERVAEAPDRLKATAIVALHDPELAVAEARRAIRDGGHVAIVLPTNPVRRRPWYDPAYDGLWATACDLDVPVCFHGIQGAYQEHLANRYLDNLMLMHAAAHPLEMMLTMGALITGGVFDRFPRLRTGFLECSAGWVPWWLWRLDEEHEKLGAADRVKLARRPSEYLHDHCFVAVEPDEAGLDGVVEAIGDESFVVSTDWPHDDSGYPHAMDAFLALPGLSQASRRKILWDNCARLYGID